MATKMVAAWSAAKLGMTSLEDRHLQDMLVLVDKCANGLTPSYLSSRLIERTSDYGLRVGQKAHSSKNQGPLHMV